MNFDDTFGTYRMFLWKRALPLFSEYPIIGTGPDSFAIRFMSEYYEDVIKLDGILTINDSACNVYLTTLINIGLVGLISYITVIFFSIKCVKNNPVKMLLLGAIIAYLVQDFFNISLVIITPFLWITMSLLTLEK
jgi:O-antigen ligase